MSKERPMLFSGQMVRAILDGSKTQTRRKVKPNKKLGADLSWCDIATHSHKLLRHQAAGYQEHCPYGKPGDRIWVRESMVWDETSENVGWVYGADYAVVRGGNALSYPRYKVPSIHMPRWASRITLEVVSVRVERLNDCSMDDALAEGVSDRDPDNGAWQNPKEQFADLWESINGPGSWDATPWVWVVGFKVIRP